ncbi:HK97-gp10 family putative phage morphogenesis protein [Sphingomonas sp. RB3P16]|uniref:HK97-gp10 family putative phage morphogenesis protein n=1 Tax=Parasphingomonas frigoris TaxID=3096163 RepID=UPI002FC9C8A4
MSVKVKIEGLAELDFALTELPKSTAKATLRRVLKQAAAPIEAAMVAKAPKLTGALKISIRSGTKLTKRQQRLAKKEGKSSSEIYVGTADPAGIPQEFGWIEGAAHPFARPAWEETQDQALAIIRENLATEIEKSRSRLAAKAARLAAKG